MRETMKKWKCTVCGYIHEGAEPPEKCPVCGAEKEKFIEVTPSGDTGDEETQERNLTSMEEAGDAATTAHPDDPPSLIEKITRLILDNHLHPISVHGPNGIIPVAVVFLLLAMMFNSSGLESAAYFNLIAVFFSMPLVLLTGYLTWKKKYNGAKTLVFKIKIAAGCLSTAILFGLIVWRTVEPDVLTTASSDRWLFLMWSMFLLAAVGLAGHLGGKLVFAKKK
jgi:uncharacterized membrane protein